LRSSPPAGALKRYLQHPIVLMDRMINEKRAEEEQAKIRP
jgi:hypothetical protein